MNLLKGSPQVLVHKVLFTALVGIGCLLVGLTYFLFSGDSMTLGLSVAILLFSFSKTFSLYRTITSGRYEVVEGTCVAVRHKALRKHFSVKIMDDAGLETTLRLGKQAKVKIGCRYRFYFTKTAQVLLGNEYFDTALSSNSFLGYEALGDIMEARRPDEDEGQPPPENVDTPAQDIAGETQV